MFIESLSLLTRQQKHALAEAKISAQLLTDWKKGRRLPTEPQAAIYADIAGIPRHALQDEIAMLRATPEQQKLLARVLGKISSGAVASIALALAALVGGAGMSTTTTNGSDSGAKATMYIM